MTKYVLGHSPAARDPQGSLVAHFNALNSDQKLLTYDGPTFEFGNITLKKPFKMLPLSPAENKEFSAWLERIDRHIMAQLGIYDA